jgi:hypothetical protein
MDALNTSPMICHLCGHQVTITACTVDENGKAVHEECYNRELATRFNESINLPRKNENDFGMASLAFGNLVIPFLL